MKLTKKAKIVLIALLAVVVVGFAASRMSQLKATDEGDAAYAGTTETGESTPEIITLTGANVTMGVTYLTESGAFEGLGTKIQLSAIPTGYPEDAELTYQWSEDDPEDEAPARVIEGAASSVLVIEITETNYTHVWSVVVSD